MPDNYAENEWIRDYLNKNLEINISEAELSIETDSTPVIYRGQGSIYQIDDYTFRFRMIHNYTDDDRERSFFHNKTQAGQLVSSEKMFRLRGLDIDGKTEWLANDIWFSPTFQIPSKGLKIEAEIDSIGYRQKMDIPIERFFCEYTFLGKYKTPPTLFVEDSDGSSSRNMCKIAIKNINVTTISNSDYLLLRIEGPKKDYSEDIIESIKEAIEIALGMYLNPIIKDLFNGNYHELIFFSPTNYRSKSLLPPFNSYLPNSSSFSNFVIQYVKKIKKPKSILYINWYKITDSKDNNLDNQGLIQGISIEGIVQKYFSDYGKPSKQDESQITDSLTRLNSIEFSSNGIKNRIIKSIQNWLGANNRTALKQLKDDGKISKEMFNSWEKSRHPLAHGEIMSVGEINEIQIFYSDSMTMLSLFYRLLFLIIDYKGKYINYAKLGYPEEELV